MNGINIPLSEYVMNSDRLYFRHVDSVDLNAVHEILCFPETDRYNTLGIPSSIEKTALILNKWVLANARMPLRKFTFGVFDKESCRLIGLFALNTGSIKYKNAKIWYKFHLEFWNRGFAIEAANAVLKFGFETLNLHRIEAGCAVENVRSIKLLERAGFQREGCRRKVIPLRSGWSDCFDYGIIEEDYKGRNVAR